ncbi:Protein of unknown function DUF1064 [uncultured Caudovirales phage]|uniref:DUF1064 domain-containing protein n=1 Tax=uncultured Caudovirales phage TaxID=2100421 RepID=A0A6J5M9R9_9CAUD|nr:Protein of unknown function DUF1064 [uncultured Caudovirales phage]CAB4158329.1 Protein of unknown function DUF1064 [uncultured Caudovirales phage]
MNKYRNKIVEVDGLKFDSAKEAARYQMLKLRARAGEIHDLNTQVKMPFIYEGKELFKYIADFTYFDVIKKKLIIEDVKSEFTKKLPVYRLKKKLIEAQYKIKIEEI